MAFSEVAGEGGNKGAPGPASCFQGAVRALLTYLGQGRREEPSSLSSCSAVPAAKEHTFAKETHEQAALCKELNPPAWAGRKREASHNSCPLLGRRLRSSLGAF